MLAEERDMPFSEFLDEIENPQPSQVLYLQKQNNCLMEEYSSLVNDVDFHIPWATEAFGKDFLLILNVLFRTYFNIKLVRYLPHQLHRIAPQYI